VDWRHPTSSSRSAAVPLPAGQLNREPLSDVSGHCRGFAQQARHVARRTKQQQHILRRTVYRQGTCSTNAKLASRKIDENVPPASNL
jgi:hypothetical protein